MTPEDSQFILDLRMRVAKNKEQGLKAREGISEEEQTKLFQLLRPARSAAATGAQKKVKKPAMSDDEATKLLNF